MYFQSVSLNAAYSHLKLKTTESETESDKGIEPPFQGILQSRISSKVNTEAPQKIAAMTHRGGVKLKLQLQLF